MWISECSTYYVINDYIAWNFDYAEYTPSATNPVTPGLEYMDYCINLDKVIRQGIEVQLNGHIRDDLSFYLGYAFQTFDSKGGYILRIHQAGLKSWQEYYFVILLAHF